MAWRPGWVLLARVAILVRWVDECGHLARSDAYGIGEGLERETLLTLARQSLPEPESSVAETAAALATSRAIQSV